MFAQATFGFAVASVVLLASASADDAGWRIRTELNGRTCRAFLAGAGIDTQIMRNDENKLILIAGHPDWDMHEGNTPLTLQIDARPAIALEGSALFRSVFISIGDDAETAEIGNATTPKWHFAWGDYQSTVTGLGATFDKLGKC